ncbi:MAG: adenylate kinase, partial [Bacteroidota bacterium]
KRRIKERAKVSGRVDDQDEAKIDNRLRVYDQETKPVAEYYKAGGKYKEVEGVGSVEDIFKQISEIVDTY